MTDEVRFDKLWKGWAVFKAGDSKPYAFVETESEALAIAASRENAEASAKLAKAEARVAALEAATITLRTEPGGEVGQHLVVSMNVGGVEVDIIRAWGAFPEIEIYHTVTGNGISAAFDRAAATLKGEGTGHE